MIQGLMHVLNEIKSRHSLALEDARVEPRKRAYESLVDWIQGEINREIDDLSKHRSEKKPAEEDIETGYF